MVVNGDINFDIVTHEPAKNLLKKILRKDHTERASLKEIFQDDWVTNNGQEKINVESVEYH